MNIQRQLLILVVSPILAITLIVGLGWTSMHNNARRSEVMMKDEFGPILESNVPEINNLQHSIVLILEADRDAHQARIALGAAVDAPTSAELTAAGEAMDENIAQVTERITEAAQSFDTAMQSTHQKFEADFSVWIAQSREIFALAGDPAQIDNTRSLFGEANADYFDTMRESINVLTEAQYARITTLQEDMQAKYDQARSIQQTMESTTRNATHGFLILGAAAALFISAFGWRTRGKLVATLSRIISQLKGGSDQLASTTEQLAANSTEIADMASSQAASVEEISATLEEMKTSTQNNADSVREAETRSNQMADSVRDGVRRIETMVASMNEISQSSDAITRIVRTIEEIAFQTNLLALNATVEAARAGEAGKGFAVVAGEVGALAKRTSDSARDTTNLIDRNSRLIQEGDRHVKEVGGNFAEISAGVERLRVLMENVTVSSAQQADSTTQLSTAAGQMDSMSQRNAASAEEASAALRDITDLATNLNICVHDLQALMGSRA